MSVSRTTPDSISSEETKHPLWRMEDFLRWAEDNGFEAKTHGHDVQAVIVGEEHKLKKSEDSQILKFIELAEKSDAKLILMEMLNNSWYDPSQDKIFKYHPDGSIETLSREDFIYPYRLILNWAYENQRPIVGIDLPMQYLMDRLDSQTRADLAALGFLLSVAGEEHAAHTNLYTNPRAVVVRDDHMASEIVTEANKHSGPVLAYVGEGHLPGIHNQLKKSDLPGHITIDITPAA